MAEAMQTEIAEKDSRKRRIGHNKGGKGKKKPKTFQGSGKKAKVDQRMQKVYRKRARDYNSDDESEEESPVYKKHEHPREKQEVFYNKSSDEEKEEHETDGENSDKSEDEDGDNSEDEYGEPGVTKFAEGCNAFRMAFNKITKKHISDNVLGPVLSDHKKLLAEKLAGEEAERKVKSLAKREKHLITEKGHVQPANYLDSHEKFLIGVATKGVVKLFNAVNKAQNAQRGLNPLRTKDAKVLKKKRKDAFFSELKGSSQAAQTDLRSSGDGDGDGPSWAPLRDTYMLTNHKLKDWDKMEQGSAVADEAGEMSDSSSDED